MTPTPVLEMRNVVAGYLPGVNILNGCSIVANQGDLIGIIGPNGAGKSTALKAIFGQVQIREGSVLLEGDDITGLKADKLVGKGVGMVPQTNNVFPSLTIEENLEMGLFQQPKMFRERMDFVGGLFPELVKRRKQRAGSLSGGERQMVAMGRALMMDPSVLLLDEPSAGLSPVRQDEAFLRVAEINSHGVTIVMVEQNARRCLQIAHRAYVLDQGRDAYTGTGREMLNDPKVIQLYLGTLATDVEEKARTSSHPVADAAPAAPAPAAPAPSAAGPAARGSAADGPGAPASSAAGTATPGSATDGSPAEGATAAPRPARGRHSEPEPPRS